MSATAGGAGPFGGSSIPALGQIVDALQQANKLNGLIYEQLKAGVSLLTTLPTYTVAGLPATAAISSLAYASNGRKNGEGGGAGTGTPVWFDVSGNWFAVWSGLQVTS